MALQSGTSLFLDDAVGKCIVFEFGIASAQVMQKLTQLLAYVDSQLGIERTAIFDQNDAISSMTAVSYEKSSQIHSVLKPSTKFYLFMAAPPGDKRIAGFCM